MCTVSNCTRKTGCGCFQDLTLQLILWIVICYQMPLFFIRPYVHCIQLLLFLSKFRKQVWDGKLDPFCKLSGSHTSFPSYSSLPGSTSDSTAPALVLCVTEEQSNLCRAEILPVCYVECGSIIWSSLGHCGLCPSPSLCQGNLYFLPLFFFPSFPLPAR